MLSATSQPSIKSGPIPGKETKSILNQSSQPTTQSSSAVTASGFSQSDEGEADKYDSLKNFFKEQ